MNHILVIVQRFSSGNAVNQRSQQINLAGRVNKVDIKKKLQPIDSIVLNHASVVE